MIVKDLFCNNEAYTHENWEYSDVVSRFSRLYYIIDGEAYYEESGRKRRLKKGCLYLTPVKRPFSLSENSSDKLLHTYVHIYTVPLVSEFTEVEVSDGTPLAEAVAMWRKYAGVSDKDLLINIIQLVLSLAEREFGRESRVARLTKDYIDDHEGVEIDMALVASHVGYTREHITRAFATAYRMTPMQYMTSRKMEIARRGVESGESVSTLADSLGYSSPYALSRAFKKYFGLSPKSYIKTTK